MSCTSFGKFLMQQVCLEESIEFTSREQWDGRTLRLRLSGEMRLELFSFVPGKRMETSVPGKYS